MQQYSHGIVAETAVERRHIMWTRANLKLTVRRVAHLQIAEERREQERDSRHCRNNVLCNPNVITHNRILSCESGLNQTASSPIVARHIPSGIAAVTI